MTTTTTPSPCVTDRAGDADMFLDASDVFADDLSAPRPAAPVFAIDSDDRANWYLRKIANLEGEESRVKAQSAAILADIAAERHRLKERFEEQLAEFVAGKLAAAGGKKKTLKFLQGSVSFRTVPGRVTLAADATDEAMDWARDNCPAALVEVPATVHLDKGAYIKHFETTGEADMPGVMVIPARESMSVSFPKAKGAAGSDGGEGGDS